MKRRLKLAVIGVLALTAGASLFSRSYTPDIVEDTIDAYNNIGVSLRKANIGTSEEVKVSKTYVQYGNEGSRQFLRFATAISGPVKSVKYTRTVDGLGSKDKEVTTVYKGIQAAGAVYYFDGTDIVTTPSELTDNFYWACYTIEFSSDTYKAADISAYITVEAEDETVEEIVSEKKETSFFEQQEALSEHYIYTVGDLERFRTNLANGYDYKDKVVTLMNDFDLGDISATHFFVKGSHVTLDLNGHTITALSTTPNLSLFRVAYNGVLTINDSSNGEGKVSFKYTGTGSWQPNYTISTQNNGGNVVINGGTIENASGKEVIASAIDNQNYGTSKNKVVVNGGRVVCEEQYGIRMFCNSAKEWNEVEINGGSVHGRRGVWLQSPSTIENAGLGRLVVNGGTITGNQYGIYLNRDAACTLEDCNIKHFEVVLKNGLQYSDLKFAQDSEEHTTVYVDNVKISSIEDLEHLKKELESGVSYLNRTVSLEADLLVENIESTYFNLVNNTLKLDLNGHKLGFTTSVAKTVATFAVGSNAKLIINDSSTEQSGELSIKYSGPTGNWGYASNIVNVSTNGAIEVNGGTLVNKTERITGVVRNGIDATNAYNKGTSVVVNGGTVNCETGYGIRLFANSKTALSYAEINGGTVKGTYPIVVQTPSSLHSDVKVVINGGEFVGFVPWTGLSSKAIYIYRDAACPTEACEEKDVEVQLNASLTVDDVSIDSYYNAAEHVNIRVPVSVTGEDALKDAVSTGNNVNVTEDIVLTADTVLATPKDGDVTINLNGNEIAYVAENSSTAYLLNVQGDVTVNGGRLEFDAVDPATGSMPTYASNAISNRGNLVLNNVEIENKSTGNASYCVDNYDGASLTINGGRYVQSGGNGVAIRMFAGSANSFNNVTINDGEFIAKRCIWLQLASSNPDIAPNVNLTINGGTFVSTDSVYNLAIYSYTYGNSFENTTITLNGGTFNADIQLGGGTKNGTYETVYIGEDVVFGEGNYVYSWSLGEYLYN